jgi:hypothetical protein
VAVAAKTLRLPAPGTARESRLAAAPVVAVAPATGPPAPYPSTTREGAMRWIPRLFRRRKASPAVSEAAVLDEPTQLLPIVSEAPLLTRGQGKRVERECHDLD